MPARILPPVSELRHMAERGMTHAEIAEEVSRKTGYEVARSTVSAAFRRAGLSANLKKHDEEIPWKVRTEHQTHYAVRMLRLLGRRRSGEGNLPANDARLDAWLAQLVDHGAAVVYLPESTDGFYYIPGAWDAPDLPIIKDFPPKS